MCKSGSTRLLDSGHVFVSMWEQTRGGCVAPDTYVGPCDRMVATSAMSKKEKFSFGTNCGARYDAHNTLNPSSETSCRWACMAPPAHVYANVCPQGWTAQVPWGGSAGLASCLGRLQIAVWKHLFRATGIHWRAQTNKFFDPCACPREWRPLWAYGSNARHGCFREEAFRGAGCKCNFRRGCSATRRLAEWLGPSEEDPLASETSGDARLVGEPCHARTGCNARPL